jgi:hypothetical protein
MSAFSFMRGVFNHLKAKRNGFLTTEFLKEFGSELHGVIIDCGKFNQYDSLVWNLDNCFWNFKDHSS